MKFTLEVSLDDETDWSSVDDMRVAVETVNVPGHARLVSIDGDTFTFEWITHD